VYEESTNKHISLNFSQISCRVQYRQCKRATTINFTSSTPKLVSSMFQANLQYRYVSLKLMLFVKSFTCCAKIFCDSSVDVLCASNISQQNTVELRAACTRYFAAFFIYKSYSFSSKNTQNNIDFYYGKIFITRQGRGLFYRLFVNPSFFTCWKNRKG